MRMIMDVLRCPNCGVRLAISEIVESTNLLENNDYERCETPYPGVYYYQKRAIPLDQIPQQHWDEDKFGNRIR